MDTVLKSSQYLPLDPYILSGTVHKAKECSHWRPTGSWTNTSFVSASHLGVDEGQNKRATLQRKGRLWQIKLSPVPNSHYSVHTLDKELAGEASSFSLPRLKWVLTALSPAPRCMFLRTNSIPCLAGRERETRISWLCSSPAARRPRKHHSSPDVTRITVTQRSSSCAPRSRASPFHNTIAGTSRVPLRGTCSVTGIPELRLEKKEGVKMLQIRTITASFLESPLE